jgi:trans-aconitate methyltransferase
VVGVDSSSEMIAYATKTYPRSQHPNLSFACTDGRSLRFKAEFDVVFSNAALHWVNDHLAFLQGANRALKNKGKLIISCGGQGNAAEVLQVFSDLVRQVPWRFDIDQFHNPYFFYGIEEEVDAIKNSTL